MKIGKGKYKLFMNKNLIYIILKLNNNLKMNLILKMANS